MSEKIEYVCRVCEYDYGTEENLIAHLHWVEQMRHVDAKNMDEEVPPPTDEEKKILREEFLKFYGVPLTGEELKIRSEWLKKSHWDPIREVLISYDDHGVPYSMEPDEMISTMDYYRQDGFVTDSDSPF
jgi:hypothetical protein